MTDRKSSAELCDKNKSLESYVKARMDQVIESQQLR
jgi:hypothetical protein